MRYRLGLRLDDLTLLTSFPTALRASARASVMVPQYCDATCYVLPTGDQGQTPSCAGQTAAAAAEVRRWRFGDVYEQIDGIAIYTKAKELDGLPGDGTTLSAAIAGAQALGYLPQDLNQYSVLPQSRLTAQYAVHRFGGFLSAWNCREDWGEDKLVYVGESGKYLGGHAVWVCGYDQYAIWFQNSWGERVGFHGLQKAAWATFDSDFLGGIALHGRVERA